MFLFMNAAFISNCFFFFVTELAASLPRTEIVGKSDYFRFGMRDSLAIEASFLQVILWNVYLNISFVFLFNFNHDPGDL